MPSKLIINLKEFSWNSTIQIQEDDEPPVQLKRVKRVAVIADSESLPHVPHVELTMYSPDFDSTVDLSDETAEAIAYLERRKLFSFLSRSDLEGLRRVARFIEPVQQHPPLTDMQAHQTIERIEGELDTVGMADARIALAKIIAELDRQAKELEDEEILVAFRRWWRGWRWRDWRGERPVTPEYFDAYKLAFRSGWRAAMQSSRRFR